MARPLKMTLALTRARQARHYATVTTVAEKIPEAVFQEDPRLLMWYDQALTRTGDEA